MIFIENRIVDGHLVSILLYKGLEITGPALRPSSYFKTTPECDTLIGALSKRQVELMQGGKLT
jgi:hypothetical protein